MIPSGRTYPTYPRPFPLSTLFENPTLDSRDGGLIRSSFTQSPTPVTYHLTAFSTAKIPLRPRDFLTTLTSLSLRLLRMSGTNVDSGDELLPLNSVLPQSGSTRYSRKTLSSTKVKMSSLVKVNGNSMWTPRSVKSPSGYLDMLGGGRCVYVSQWVEVDEC